MSKGGEMRKPSGLLAVYCLLFAVFVAGCVQAKAQLKEYAKGFAGISTQVLQDSRKDALKMAFPCDYANAFSQAKETLRNRGYYIYAQSAAEGMIAAYCSELDTTPVGVFFKELDSGNTEVEISSPAAYAKEAAAKQLFPALNRACSKQSQVKNES
jgi:hypothetical protein